MDQKGKGQIRIAGGISGAKLHAVIFTGGGGDPNELRPVLVGPGDVAGSLKRSQTPVGIGQGVEEGGDFSHMFQNAGDKALGALGVARSHLKEIFSSLGQGQVDMQPIAAAGQDRFGQKGGVQPVPVSYTHLG